MVCRQYLAPSAVERKVSAYNRVMLPQYWSQAIAELSGRDATLAKLFERHVGLSLVSRGDAFHTLARSIVGQQISVKAADAVWNRLLAQCGEMTPGKIEQQGADALAGGGLSQRKVEYLCDLAAHFLDGRLSSEHLQGLGDEAVIAELTAVRGIGRWTAEMFLIFNLLRPDVLPLDDFGLQRAIGDHYFSGNRPQRRVMAELGEHWRPWRSVATWYLWRSLDPVPVAY